MNKRMKTNFFCLGYNVAQIFIIVPGPASSICLRQRAVSHPQHIRLNKALAAVDPFQAIGRRSDPRLPPCNVSEEPASAHYILPYRENVVYPNSPVHVRLAIRWHNIGA